MSNSTPLCGIVFKDGTACRRPVRVKSKGWCGNCHSWSLRNANADPNGRPHKQRSTDGRCILVEDGNRCPLKSHTRDLCEKHRDRVRRHGDPLAVTAPPPRVTRPLLLAAARAEAGSCFLVPGAQGRPYAYINGKHMFASRAVWILAMGTDPGDAVVRHTCNGGSGSHGCINFRHLTLGSPQDNSTDMVRAGRSCRGEDVNTAKLTEEDVREVRRLAAAGMSQRAIAARFGMTKTPIANIINGKSWAWLE